MIDLQNSFSGSIFIGKPGAVFLCRLWWASVSPKPWKRKIGADLPCRFREKRKISYLRRTL